jgi:hypothetical protein
MQMTKFFLPLLTITVLLVTPKVALADYRVGNGGGGHFDERGNLFSYEYEVWSDDTNTEYTLKVWQSKNYPNGRPEVIESFKSARRALDYFDCHYSQKEDVCEQMNRN